MFDQIKDKILNVILTREFVLMILAVLCSGALIWKIFDLQIVHGEEYLENFQLTIQKEISIPATRGNIYDRNNKLLAYNELAYSVTIEDVYESGRTKNRDLNNTIYQTIKLIEKSGDQVDSDFGIILDAGGNYKYNVSDNALLRFLADVYGHSSVNDLSVREKNASAEDVMNYLCSTQKYGVGTYYYDEGNALRLDVGAGYTKSEILKIITVRYAMSANSYQKYIATTIATNVNEKTVAVISENKSELDGVNVAEDTIRKYIDAVYFSQIIGYTGKISSDRLSTYRQTDPTYSLNDQIGLAGIEYSMESVLRGTKGSQILYVDNTGKQIDSSDYVASVAGNNVYLTIDAELQKAAYNILEQKIAGIVVSKLQNVKEYKASANSGASSIIIPIYDTYIAMIENNVLDIAHFATKSAGDTEKAVYEKFLVRKEEELSGIREELMNTHTVYNKLATEYQAYQLYVISVLTSNNVLMSSKIDTTDTTYLAWKRDETISLSEYLKHCIASDWIDVTKLDMDMKYADSDEIFSKLVDYSISKIENDSDFDKKIYRFMIKNDKLTGREICQMLIEQHVVSVSASASESLYNGKTTAYQFMVNLITNLDITPAQLALEPCTGSMVITDVKTGDVLACVSYPSYDSNKMANSVDAAYFASLQNDRSRPLYNYATQERTAPGSTFKMVSATAGLMEGVISTSSTISCHGIFEKDTLMPRCWIYPGGHGSLSVAGAIQNSCNVFFYEVGYRLGTDENGAFNSDAGIQKLAVYADLYGLSEKSGVEIEETMPQVSDFDVVRSAIGQGTNNYTTISLARYVTAVANSGTCYNLTVIDKVTDYHNNLLWDNQAEIRNTIEMPAAFWNNIHAGMRRMVQSKAYFDDMTIAIAGKTGTAQQSTSHPNHALFVSYAPYDDPEIAVAARIAFGYSSDYAAQAAKDMYSYYYKLDEEENILTGKATTSATAVGVNND